MNKAILISIEPSWCDMIAAGQKTIEVRKTKPKLETPFKCYIYCTNKRPFLVWGDVSHGNGETEFTRLSGYSRKEAEKTWDIFNGKVMGEFICNEIERFSVDPKYDNLTLSRMSRLSCASTPYLQDYASDCWLYGWHISDFKIYDEPLELSNFYVWKKCNSCRDAGYESTACCYDEDCKVPAMITRPPQSWCYVEELKGGEEE